MGNIVDIIILLYQVCQREPYTSWCERVFELLMRTHSLLSLFALRHRPSLTHDDDNDDDDV